MKRQGSILERGSNFLHRYIWKKLGTTWDEKMKKRFRLFYTGTEAELEEMVDEYRRKQIRMLLVFFCAAIVLGIFLSLTDRKSNSSITIQRNSYGEGEKEESLILENGEAITFTVEEQEYGEEEKEKVFSDGFQWIREHMLLENQSAGEVESDLNFMTEVPGGLTAEWLSEEPEILGSDGTVFNENWEEGEKHLVRVQLFLSYQEQTEIQNLNFYVKSPSYTEEEMQARIVKKTIEEKEKETRQEESFVIPGKIAGVSLQETDVGKNYGWMILLGAMFLFVFFYHSNRMKEQGKKRKRQLEEDYPLLINKLVLYLGAGINLKMAFQQIVQEYGEDLASGRIQKRYVYEELIVMIHEMQAGTGELIAYEALGRRIGLNAYTKLLALLIQNRQKGNEGLLKALKTEETNAFFLRIDQAKRAGEEAGTKLLFPMLGMLLIVMVIVMAPALLQFRFY